MDIKTGVTTKQSVTKTLLDESLEKKTSFKTKKRIQHCKKKRIQHFHSALKFVCVHSTVKKISAQMSGRPSCVTPVTTILYLPDMHAHA
jgi:hypothetical protein